jgi:hypothetical protein
MNGPKISIHFELSKRLCSKYGQESKAQQIFDWLNTAILIPNLTWAKCMPILLLSFVLAKKQASWWTNAAFNKSYALHQHSSVIQQKWSRLQCQDAAAVLVSVQMTTKLVLDAVIRNSKHSQGQITLETQLQVSHNKMTGKNPSFILQCSFYFQHKCLNNVTNILSARSISIYHR